MFTLFLAINANPETNNEDDKQCMAAKWFHQLVVVFFSLDFIFFADLMILMITATSAHLEHVWLLHGDHSIFIFLIFLRIQIGKLSDLSSKFMTKSTMFERHSVAIGILFWFSNWLNFLYQFTQGRDQVPYECMPNQRMQN